MNKLLHEQLDHLRRLVLGLGTRVETQVHDAWLAIDRRDFDLAKDVMARDRGIDATEVEIEEECLMMLALYQPVAYDLRFITAMMKMNTQLERVGDLAVNLADQARMLTEHPPIRTYPFDLQKMSEITLTMLRLSLDAMLSMNDTLADEVRELDDQVDEIHRSMYPTIGKAIEEDPNDGPALILLMSMSKQFERIADHACGIAKDVLYLTRGEIVRHSRKLAKEQSEENSAQSADSASSTV